MNKKNLLCFLGIHKYRIRNKLLGIAGKIKCIKCGRILTKAIEWPRSGF